jgi:hypothetical protein
MKPTNTPRSAFRLLEDTFGLQMLGHSNIASTQIYTRVSLRALEAVHSATHPGAANEPRIAGGDGGEGEAEAK